MIRLLLLLLSLSMGCDKPVPTEKMQELHLNIPCEPATLDPRKGGDLISSCMHFMLFEGLTCLNPDSSTSPAQAETIDISEDKKTYTFHLRETQWSDGSPVTAYDFEKSWKDILDPGFPSVNAHLLYSIKNAEPAKKGLVSLQEVGITAVDAKTLVVTLENPTPHFLQITSFCVLFPVNSAIDQKHPQWAYRADAHFVCNGPFILERWDHNHEITFIKNPFYREKESIALEKVHISMIDNEMTALQMYEKGQLDMLGMPFSTLPVDAIKDLSEKGALHTSPTGGSTVCFFNVSEYPFNNANIRKAFALAINRESIVKNITQLNEPIATGMIPPILKNGKITHFFTDGDTLTALRYFQKGLQELDITAADFPEITLSYYNSELHHKIVQAMQQQWYDTLNVRVKIENLEMKVLMDKMTKRNYTISLFMWAAQYDDQMNILERFKTKENVKNYCGWENQRYAQLLDKSAYDETTEQRLKTLEKAEALILDEMPILPIYHWTYAYMMKPYLHNYCLTSIGDVLIEKITLDMEKKTR